MERILDYVGLRRKLIRMDMDIYVQLEMQDMVDVCIALLDELENIEHTIKVFTALDKESLEHATIKAS